MNLIDIDALGPVELAALFEKAAAVIRNGGGAHAADRVAVQLDFMLPESAAEDLGPPDLNELLADGTRRYLAPKECAPIARCGEDKLRAMVREKKAGFVVSGRYFIDRLKIMSFK